MQNLPILSNQKRYGLSKFVEKSLRINGSWAELSTILPRHGVTPNSVIFKSGTRDIAELIAKTGPCGICIKKLIEAGLPHKKKSNSAIASEEQKSNADFFQYRLRNLVNSKLIEKQSRGHYKATSILLDQVNRNGYLIDNAKYWRDIVFASEKVNPNLCSSSLYRSDFRCIAEIVALIYLKSDSGTSYCRLAPVFFNTQDEYSDKHYAKLRPIMKQFCQCAILDEVFTSSTIHNIFYV